MLKMFVYYPWVCVLVVAFAQSVMGLQSLTPGSSMAVDNVNQLLVSPNGTFSCGFYRVGNNSYCFSIWFTNSFDKTVVWMANRDKPVNGEKSKLTLNLDSSLVLTDADGSAVWSSDTVSSGGGFELQLLETGNLVVRNQSEDFIWQSFDSPLDTLLPEQRFLKASTLTSMQSPGVYFAGVYQFKFNDFNVLNLLYNSPSISGVYWPDTTMTNTANDRSTYNSSKLAILDKKGRFESSDRLRFSATDYGLGPKRRLTMDYDGLLRLYSLDESTGNWTITWIPSGLRLDPCMVYGVCGDYGICEYNPLPACTCPPGFVRNDPSDWTKGCKPVVNVTCDSSEEMDFIRLPNTDYFGHDSVYKDQISLEACRNLCLSSCDCPGFGYGSEDGLGQCYPKTALRNGYRKPGTFTVTFIKVKKGESLSLRQQHSEHLNCSISEFFLGSDHGYENPSKKFRFMGLLIGVVVVIGICELLFVSFGWWNVFRKKVSEELVNMGYIVLAMGFKRFPYEEMKRATKNFKHEIGKGGFGTVYKGELDDGRVVAVKRLDGVLQGDAEFWAEVSIIGKINHKNLVKLWGFCIEKHHKMLVYEYVENGSLDKLLFSDSCEVLGLDERYEIAVGTAKGLSYLHEECLEWVLHCDIKPQNILLNEDLEAKVADFGMSKIFREINESGFSKVRGTRGYLAPEWMMNLKIDARADVYSYGIVLLELISGKNAYDFQSSIINKDGGSRDLVKWITKVAEEGEIHKVMDPKLKLEVNQNKKIKTLLKVALLCVREDRDKRPPMSRVVELLTGYEDSSSHGDVYH